MLASLDPHSYLLFVALVTVMVASPGPSLFLLLSTVPGASAQGGRQIGLCMVGGFCAAILSHATAALLGVGALIAASATLFTVVRTVGAIYLLWLGIRALLALWAGAGPVRGPVTGPIRGPVSGRAVSVPLSLPGAFGRGYLTNILNPKPAIFYLAVFPQFLGSSGTGPETLWGGLALGGTHALIALGIYGSVVLLIDRAASLLMRPVVATGVRSLSAVVLIGLGGRLLLVRP